MVSLGTGFLKSVGNTNSPVAKAPQGFCPGRNCELSMRGLTNTQEYVILKSEKTKESKKMSVKRDTLTCPNCGQVVEAEEDDVIDTSFFQDEMSMFCVGHCPKCNAQIQWDAVFTFSHVKNVEVS